MGKKLSLLQIKSYAKKRHSKQQKTVPVRIMRETVSKSFQEKQNRANHLERIMYISGRPSISFPKDITEVKTGYGNAYTMRQ